MKKFRMLLPGITLMSASLASAQPPALTLLDGESATSAQTLYRNLNGSNVQSSGTVKSVILSPSKGSVLECNLEKSSCIVKNSDFIQTFNNNDFDNLLVLEGEEADSLIQSLPTASQTPTRLYLFLGYHGPYGSNQLTCERMGGKSKCQLLRLYCYQPGC
jgi:hypothetical protein